MTSAYKSSCCARGQHLQHQLWCDLEPQHEGPHSVMLPAFGACKPSRWFWTDKNQTTCDTVMRDAWDLTTRDRHNQYGKAEDAFRAYGHIWTGLLAHKLAPDAVIDAADVALMMTGLKIAREVRSSKRDNVVDAHGYLSLLSRIRGWIS